MRDGRQACQGLLGTSRCVVWSMPHTFVVMSHNGVAGVGRKRVGSTIGMLSDSWYDLVLPTSKHQTLRQQCNGTTQHTVTLFWKGQQCDIAMMGTASKRVSRRQPLPQWLFP